jgi:hypothetical protein
MEAAGEESVVKKAACRVQEGKSPTFCELQVLRTRLLVRDMETKHFYAREKTAVLYVAKKSIIRCLPPRFVTVPARFADGAREIFVSS